MIRCVALSYRLPREPTRPRLAVWRRLKRLGAVLFHNAVWLLPEDGATREAFEWLLEEIEEQGGTGLVWQAMSLSEEQDQVLVTQFRAEADERYTALARSAEVLFQQVSSRHRPDRARLHQVRRQLAGFERAMRLERRRDYFRAPGRKTAQAALATLAEGLDQRLQSLTQQGAA